MQTNFHYRHFEPLPCSRYPKHSMVKRFFDFLFSMFTTALIIWLVCGFGYLLYLLFLHELA